MSACFSILLHPPSRSRGRLGGSLCATPGEEGRGCSPPAPTQHPDIPSRAGSCHPRGAMGGFQAPGEREVARATRCARR